MTVYIAVLAFTLFTSRMFVKTYYTDDGFRINKGLFGIVIILLIWTLVYMNRGNAGSDTSGYRAMYELIISRNEDLLTRLEMRSSTPLYALIEWCCCRITGGNWKALCVVISLIAYIPVLRTIGRESEDFSFSIFLFITTMQFFGCYNGVKQSLAYGISIIAYFFYLKERRIKGYILLMIISALFHSSALIIIPLHLVSMRRLKSFSTLLILLIAFISSFFAVPLLETVTEIAGQMGYTTVARYNGFSEGGSGILRVVVCLIPPLLATRYYDLISDDGDYNLDGLIIFGYLESVFMLFSISNWIFARIGSYFSIGTVFLVPKLLPVFGYHNRGFTKLFIGTLYFGYMIALLLHGESNLIPYGV